MGVKHLTEKYVRRNLSNPLWRINNLYDFVDDDAGSMAFNLNWAQKQLNRDLHTRNLVYKARQVGASTYIQLLGLDRCLFNDYYAFGCVAHDVFSAQALFDRKAKHAYDSLPDWLKEQVPLVARNRSEMKFGNGSFMRVAAGLRSGTYQMIHISELAAMEWKDATAADEVLTGTLNAIANQGTVFVESTSRGPHGLFPSLWKTYFPMERDALLELDFLCHFFPAYKEPRYRQSEDGPIPEHIEEYFKELRKTVHEKIPRSHMVWYAAKEKILKDRMKAEYPQTPEEGFEVILKGTYFGKRISEIRHRKQLEELPITSGAPIEVYAHFGNGDVGTLLFGQRDGAWMNWIDFYQEKEQDIAHYVQLLKRYEADKGYNITSISMAVSLSDHDSLEVAATETLQDGGFLVRLVPHAPDRRLKVDHARKCLDHCRFDPKRFEKGVEALQSYRRKQNDQTGLFEEEPERDWAHYAAEAFMVYTEIHRTYGAETPSDDPAIDDLPEHSIRAAVADAQMGENEWDDFYY